jgi:hypothetical protein
MCCWNVATHRWKITTGKLKSFLLSETFVLNTELHSQFLSVWISLSLISTILRNDTSTMFTPKDKHMPCSQKKTSTCHVHTKRQTHTMFTQKDKHIPCSHKKTNTCHVHTKRQTHAMFTQKDKHMPCSRKKTNTCHVHTKRQTHAMFTQKDKHNICTHR